MTGIYVAIDRLVPDEDENDTLRQELNLYIDLSGQFGSPAAKRSMTKVAPCKYKNYNVTKIFYFLIFINLGTFLL